MGGSSAELTGPDFAMGIEAGEVPDGGTLLGHAHGESVVLVRNGESLFAISASCTHYGGPLAEGLVEGESIRCPWHHARFDLRTGEPMAPALNPITCWRLEKSGTRVVVKGKDNAKRTMRVQSGLPQSVVIVGAGAAGNACAETLRREGYMGKITMIGADESVPVDRPNLSKDYLAGTAPEEWIPLRGKDYYEEQNIEIMLGARVEKIDVAGKTVELAGGKSVPWHVLVLATGADPVKLTVPGAELPHVQYLRTLADSRGIIAKATASGTKKVVVVGASFIGLEAAGALRARNLEVHVVGPEKRPLERVMGKDVGDFVRALHEEKGVTFHMGETVTKIDAKSVTLASGATIDADLVVVGIGVRAATALGEEAGLTNDRGIVVDDRFLTSAAGVYACGDIARYPDPRTGRKIRVEHWVVAERQGEAVARSILGRKDAFGQAPFFWSQHYDVGIGYVGHAETFDASEVHGSLEKRDACVVLREAGKIRAVITIGRDKTSLRAEAAMERGDEAELERVVAS